MASHVGFPQPTTQNLLKEIYLKTEKNITKLQYMWNSDMATHLHLGSTRGPWSTWSLKYEDFARFLALVMTKHVTTGTLLSESDCKMGIKMLALQGFLNIRNVFKDLSQCLHLLGKRYVFVQWMKGKYEWAKCEPKNQRTWIFLESPILLIWDE